MRRAPAACALLFAACAGDGDRSAQPVLTLSPRIEVVFEPGELALPRERLQRWVDETTQTILETFGSFPVPAVELHLMPRPGSRGIHDGTTRDTGTGAAIEVGVGSLAQERALEQDWVLVHEMIHLVVPQLPMEQHWFEEGVATYLEPFARARAGRRTEEEVWRELTRDYRQGNPRPGEKGIDDTPTWARTYYGGALFCLVADVEIGRATHGAKSLRDAFRGTVSQGASILQSCTMAEFAAKLDAAVGVDVVSKLYARWAHEPVEVDLGAQWKELGVVRSGRQVTFDASAPLAAWRAKLVAKPADTGTK